MSKLQTFFKVRSKDTKEMCFGKKSALVFNYVDLFDSDALTFTSKASLSKQMNNSFALDIDYQSPSLVKINELKITNQEITSWEDYWIDGEKRLVDPLIAKINLQKNQLIHANFNLPRTELTHLNLEGNKPLRAIFVPYASKLEELNFSGCDSLESVILGSSKLVKKVVARNCNLTEQAQVSLLRALTPTLASSSNAPFSMFRKTYSTVLDVRGSEMVWSNRKIASKIRLLLCNNWLVLWDNTPPPSIIPPQMYSFFSSNLQDSLIKDYYG